jgi:hypothetical protein
VINNHPVAHYKTPAAWTGVHDLAAGFVPGNHPLISFRPFPEVFVVNASDIGAADS